MYVFNSHYYYLFILICDVVLDDVKKKAERQRDPDERLEFSQLAVDVAEMSQSVRLFKEVAEWARRFIRDPVSLNIPHNFWIELTQMVRQ